MKTLRAIFISSTGIKDKRGGKILKHTVVRVQIVMWLNSNKFEKKKTSFITNLNIIRGTTLMLSCFAFRGSWKMKKKINKKVTWETNYNNNTTEFLTIKWENNLKHFRTTFHLFIVIIIIFFNQVCFDFVFPFCIAPNNVLGWSTCIGLKL